MARLYVLGAKQRDLLLRNEQEWNLYEAALIVELDTESGSVRTCVEYKSPPEVRPSPTSSCVFKTGTLIGNVLYTCTSTEVLIFQLPDFRRIGYVSLPCFNDLHHVTPAADGNLLAAVTGLDMVVKFSPAGEMLAEWSVLPEAPWSRFSRSTDYRLVETTKPHKSHPNFVFELGNEIWATRFHQRDAVCLTDMRKRIDIRVESPHDGLLFEGKLYFTTVDGRVLVADPATLQVERIVDLKQVDGQSSLLGWCRGLLPIDRQRVWVGFTQIRKTRFRENVLWVRNILREGMRERPSHIALYDIASMRLIEEFDLEAHGMNVIFSIFPAS